MHLELLKDARKAFPEVKEPSSVTSAFVWHCKFKSYSQLEAYTSLKELKIGGLPDSDLGWILPLKNLEYLSINHLPKVKDLSDLGHLKNLKTLSLSTAPSWDASGKTLQVESMDFLGLLQKLEHLELFGVHDSNFDLSSLKLCKKLKSLRVSQYPEESTAELYSTRKITRDFAPELKFISS